VQLEEEYERCLERLLEGHFISALAALQAALVVAEHRHTLELDLTECYRDLLAAYDHFIDDVTCLRLQSVVSGLDLVVTESVDE